MIAPDIAPVIAYAQETIQNLPRYTDFSRPEALTLDDLDLASASDAVFTDEISDDIYEDYDTSDWILDADEGDT